MNFGLKTEKFWGSVVFYILRPSRHCGRVGRSDPSRIRDLFSKASMLGRYGMICFIKVLLIIDFFYQMRLAGFALANYWLVESDSISIYVVYDYNTISHHPKLVTKQ